MMSCDHVISKIQGTLETRKARKVRKARKIFMTAYPYGLNDKIDDDKNSSNTDMIGSLFPPLKRNSSHVRCVKHITKNKMGPNDFLHQMNKSLLFDLPNTMNFLRTSISALNKKSLKLIADKVNDELLRLPDHFKYWQWYLAILDSIKSKLYKPVVEKVKRKPPENICHVTFSNKAVEQINIAAIFNTQTVKSTLTDICDEFETPTVVYDLKNTIRSKIFNFNKFVSSIDVDEFLRNPESIPCERAGSNFLDKHHGHILTGDLRIVSNKKLPTRDQNIVPKPLLVMKIQKNQ